MSVSPQGLERIIHKIDTFRKEIVDIVRSDDHESMICELNIQFFPLSKELEAPKDAAEVPDATEGDTDEEGRVSHTTCKRTGGFLTCRA